MPNNIGAYQGGPGIEQISRRNNQSESQLPQGESTPPIDSVVQLQLPQVLFQPSLDQALTEALQPTIQDRSILRPERFQALVESSREQLLDLADSIKQDTARERLREADEVLGRTVELRELLRSLQSLVQQA